jgi:Na+/proline symporter
MSLIVEHHTGAPFTFDPFVSDISLVVAGMLALFAILFGTREIDATEHHHGMILAVALESLVKLVAFVAVGVFALGHLPGSEDLLSRFQSAARDFVAPGIPQGFMAQTLLAFAAIVCLPRQFHVAVVECSDVADVRSARWLFSGYLAIICLFVLPITAAGQFVLAGTGASPDAYVLALPMALDNTALALAAYVGGFSAATGMVIVASVALATMVSNDLVMPLLWRDSLTDVSQRQHIGQRVLWVRRIAIVAIALLAYAYYRGASSGNSLAAFGLLAFAAVGQFAPALIGGLYWRGASRRGVIAGLLAGFSLWTYTLLLPTLTRAGWFDAGWLVEGPLGIRWLRPEQLFGLQGWMRSRTAPSGRCW